MGEHHSNSCSAIRLQESDLASASGNLKLYNFPDLQHTEMPELLSISAAEEQVQ